MEANAQNPYDVAIVKEQLRRCIENHGNENGPISRM